MDAMYLNVGTDSRNSDSKRYGRSMAKKLVLSIYRILHVYLSCVVHDMMEYRTQEMHQQMEIVKSELTDSQTKLSRLTTQESALVQQNAKKSTQLTKEEKKRLEHMSYMVVCINI